jgi:hypothetical protein
MARPGTARINTRIHSAVSLFIAALTVAVLLQIVVRPAQAQSESVLHSFCAQSNCSRSRPPVHRNYAAVTQHRSFPDSADFISI